MIRKDKSRVDLYGDRFRARAHQLTPRLHQVATYINENREAVMEQTAMEIAALLKTSDATVVRAIQALGFAGLRDLKSTLEHWFGPVISASEKISTTVNILTSDVNSSIDFVLEGHQHTCEVLSEPNNRYAMAQAVALLSEARQVAIFGIGASGVLAEYTARMFSRMGLPATALNRTGIGLAEQLIELQRGDVLVMMVGRTYHPNHAAIYLGDDGSLVSEPAVALGGQGPFFIHHLYGRSSTRNIYGPDWAMRTRLILRHQQARS